MTSFKWEKFYNVGIHLIEYSTEEEYARSAVGRFYYACFNLTKSYYENTHNYIIPSNNSHEILINKLINSVYSEEKDLRLLLRDLRRYRNYADYSINFKLKNMKLSKKNSDELIKILNNLNENPIIPKF